MPAKVLGPAWRRASSPGPPSTSSAIAWRAATGPRRRRPPFSPSLTRGGRFAGLIALLILFPLLGGYAFLVVASVPSRRLEAARYGDFSYGLYLYAFPVQLLLINWLGPGLTPDRLSLIAGPATLVLAVLSWHLVEKSCLRWKPAIGRPRE